MRRRGLPNDVRAGAKPTGVSNREAIFRLERPDRRFRFGNDTMPPRFAGRNTMLLILLTLARKSPPKGWHGQCSLIPASAFEAAPCPVLGQRAGTPGEHVLKLAPSLELYAYWDALRGARGAPERNDIEPGALRGVLADTFILEYSPERGFPFRIVGSRTNGLFCRELRGESFLDLWARNDVDEVQRVVQSAADGAQPFLIGASGAPEGGLAIDLEVLVLPLRHHGATHARALGCCAPSVSSSWFGLLPLRPLAIASLRALSATPAPAFSPLRTSSAAFRRHGHLFVYSSRN
jgi:hypothetical protein